MKKYWIVLLMMLLVHPLYAQQVYVNGTLVPKEQLNALPTHMIDSMKKSVEDGEFVVHILLKKEVNGDSIIQVIQSAPKVESVTNQAATAEEQRAHYLQTRQLYTKNTLIKNGEKVPDFTLPNYEGKAVSLSQYTGKVVLIQFWASWCGPCLMELYPTRLPEALKPYVNRPDFVFLPIAHRDTKEQLDKFWDTKNGQNYLYLKEKTLIDPAKKVLALFTKSSGIPYTVLVDKDGTIRYGSMGYLEEQQQELIHALADILK